MLSNHLKTIVFIFALIPSFSFAQKKDLNTDKFYQERINFHQEHIRWNTLYQIYGNWNDKKIQGQILSRRGDFENFYAEDLTYITPGFNKEDIENEKIPTDIDFSSWKKEFYWVQNPSKSVFIKNDEKIKGTDFDFFNQIGPKITHEEWHSWGSNIPSEQNIEINFEKKEGEIFIVGFQEDNYKITYLDWNEGIMDGEKAYSPYYYIIQDTENEKNKIEVYLIGYTAYRKTEETPHEFWPFKNEENSTEEKEGE